MANISGLCQGKNFRANELETKYVCRQGEQFFHIVQVNGSKRKFMFKNSGQDGDVGGYIFLLHTTKIRTTTNLKTKTNQNYQKIEIYGSPTIKELKNKHSSRLVGGAEIGSQA